MRIKTLKTFDKVAYAQKNTSNRENENLVMNEKGITLIALVVTIVVLLILAGVTIHGMVGDNSILTKSKAERANIEEKQSSNQNHINTLEERLNEIIPDIGVDIEIGTNYIKLTNVRMVSYEGTVDSYEYYIKKEQDGNSSYKQVTTSEINEVTARELIHNQTYKIKIIAKNGTKEVRTVVKTVKTKELICTDLNMITVNDGNKYEEGTWTGSDVQVSLVDNSQSTYSSIEGSAQTIVTTKNTSNISTSGITSIKVETTDGTNTVSKKYIIKIDNMGPTIEVISQGLVDQYPEILTIRAKENIGKVSYIELPDGTRIQGNGTNTLTTTYNATKNGPITFKASDDSGNIGTGIYTVENVISFDTEWTIARDNTTVIVPVIGTVDVYIDYGDGTKENVTTANPTHTYSAGTYIMKISGKCTSFSYNVSTGTYLTGLKKWGCLENSLYAFGTGNMGCINMKGNIPSPHSKSFRNITSFANTFSYCYRLTGSIPEDLFANCNNVNSYASTFAGCSGLTGNIPEKLFADCNSVNSYMSTFAGCSKLTGSIPEALFLNCNNVNSYASTFAGCSGLTGSIPEKLFENGNNVTNFYYAFAGCSGLTGNIPTKLFYKCSKATSFDGTFNGCKGLTGNIPENLFINCNLAQSFYGTFDGCEKLTGSIPANLFKNCNNAVNFSQTFRYCTGLTGNIPEALFTNCNKATNFANTFFLCTGLNGNIPEKLFANCPNIIYMSGVFFGCSNLKGSIPENLFANCSQVTSFGTSFYNCKGLTGSIPEKLFVNCKKVTDFSGTFSGCTGLTGNIPANLFDNCQSVMIFGSNNIDMIGYPTYSFGTFSGCTSLTGNAPELWNRTNVRYHNYCFYGCTQLDNYADIPDTWK